MHRYHFMTCVTLTVIIKTIIWKVMYLSVSIAQFAPHSNFVNGFRFIYIFNTRFLFTSFILSKLHQNRCIIAFVKSNLSSVSSFCEFARIKDRTLKIPQSLIKKFSKLPDFTQFSQFRNLMIYSFPFSLVSFIKSISIGDSKRFWC